MSRLLLALALAASAAVAEAAAPPPVTRHVLPNGLTVVVREDVTLGVMAAALHVRAGSLFETADTAGITNFLQRVMLRGTQRYTALGLTEAIDDLGGSLEAAGDVEYGDVHGTALARNWEPMLRLVAEVALRPTLPAEEIERERRLILSAIQTRGDTPFQRAFDSVLNDLYGPHPYSWPSVGRRESVERTSREMLREHYTSIYRADRMVLAVSGTVLGGGMSGRLFRELREQRGLAYSVGMLGSFRTGRSFLVSYLGTAPPNAEAAEAGMLAEIERMRGEPVTEGELARAKAYLL